MAFHRRLAGLALAACCAVLAGCGQERPSPLERFEKLPSVEELVTVPLGSYIIPIPLFQELDSLASPTATQMQVEFALHAAVLPEFETAVREGYEEMEGRFRDSVIRVCRNTPMEDWMDPSLTTLKTHLTDTLGPYFDGADIERIHIADPQVKKL